MPFRGTAEHMLDSNVSLERLVADEIMTAYARNLSMSEDDRFQKLVLISLTPDVKDVATEDVVHIMTLALEEDRINYYVMSHRTYVGYLNNN